MSRRPTRMKLEKLKDPRICRIFFSSPFGGMEAEREELTRKYFPQVQHLCNKYGVQFIAVDMRWGITSEASASSQVINICLRELDKSDFFAGFFGQRYGWHGREDETLQENINNAVSRYPWLDTVRDKSVTEFEFLHGHLNSPGDLPAVICFRNKEYDNKEREDAKVKGEKKREFKFTAESDQSVKLMEDLKQRCWTTKDQTYGVHLDYKDPSEGAKIIFDAIWKHLNEILPKQKHIEAESKRSLRLSQHDAFLASRQKMYGTGDEKLLGLCERIDKEKPNPVVIIGEPGCGKSTLLSILITKLRSEFKSQVCVVYHFIGHAQQSTNPVDILKQLIDELEYSYSIMQGTEYKEMNEDEENVRELIRRLEVVICKVQDKGKKCVIIIDGVEKVSKQSIEEKTLFWLPRQLPDGAFLVVSSVSTNIDIITELQDNRSYDIVKIEPLSEEMRHDFSVETLKESGKELSTSQLQKIVQTKPTENPLFLTVVLNELVVFGYFRLLDQKIDSLIESSSTEELFDKVLKRLEEDYITEEHDGNLIEQVTCTICLSRQGMSIAELTEMYNIASHVWSPFYFAVEKYFIDQAGLIQFGFGEFRQAVQRRYLNTEQNRKHYLTQIAAYFEQQKDKFGIQLSKTPAEVHTCEELPMAYRALDDTKKMAQSLANLNILNYMMIKDKHRLFKLWKETHIPFEDVADMYLKSVDAKIVNLYLQFEQEGKLETENPGLEVAEDLRTVNSLLQLSHCYKACEKILQRILDIVENKKTVEDISRRRNLFREAALYSLACNFKNSSQLEKSLKLHLELLKIREMRVEEYKDVSEDDLKDLGHSYNGIATIYLDYNDVDKAEEYFIKSLECYKRNGDINKENTATALQNLGYVYSRREEYDKAIEYTRKCIEIFEEEHFGRLSHEISLALTNLGLYHRKLNQLEEAEKLYWRSLEIKKNTLGERHPDLAVTYTNLAVIETIRDNDEKALNYHQESYDIYKENNIPKNDLAFVRSAENIIVSLINLNRLAEAKDRFMPFFELVNKERLQGHNYLIDGTLPFVHNTIIKYLISEDEHEEARRILLIFLKTKATNTVDYILLDEIDKKLYPGKDRPDVDETMTLEYAFQRWPLDYSLYEHKARTELIPAENSEGLIAYINKLLPEYGEQIYHATNRIIEQQFTEQMLYAVNLDGVKNYPDSVPFLYNIADSLVRQDDKEQAIEYFKRMVHLNPDLPDVYIKLAHCFGSKDNPELEEAKRYCKIAQEKSEDEPQLQERADFLMKALLEAEEANK